MPNSNQGNNNQNQGQEMMSLEQAGKLIGAAVAEAIKLDHEDWGSSRGNQQGGTSTEDGVRLNKDGTPDGRQTSPIRGGKRDGYDGDE